MPPISEMQPKWLNQPLGQENLSAKDGEILRFDSQLMWSIASQIVDYSLQIQPGDRLWLEFHPGGRQLAKMVGYLAGSRQAAVYSSCVEPAVEAAILAGMGTNGDLHTERTFPWSLSSNWATKVVFINFDENPHVMDNVSTDVQLARMQARESTIAVRREGKVDWLRLDLPSPAEATINEMTYVDYLKLVLPAYDMDWREVEKAQEILIEKMNAGKQLKLIADAENEDKMWRTELEMSIEEMTFANSTVKRNYPGSEVFSGPKRGTINGRLALPYPVMFAGKVLPNLILEFQNGKVVNHYTTGDMQWVQDILDTDEGSREVGEVAFGTNAILNRPLLNPLLVEKVGGSFHIAIGNAHEAKVYDGKPVNIDNGVRSKVHIDLTRMMQKAYGGGKVLLDDELISQDGIFQDSRLLILNPAVNNS